MEIKEKALLATTHVIFYLNNGISDEEARYIGLIQEMITKGRSKEMLSSKLVEQYQKIRSAATYFDQHPRSYVVIAGGGKLPKQQIVSIARTFGINPKHLRLHLDYPKLKKMFPMQEIANAHCIGVILGPSPHYTNGINGHKSAVDAVKALKNGSTVLLPDLKITKEGLRTGFTTIVDKIACL